MTDLPPAPGAPSPALSAPEPPPAPEPPAPNETPRPPDEGPRFEIAPDLRAPGETLPMSIGGAIAWSCGTILTFWFLAGLVATIRPDLIALFACEAFALLAGALFIWFVHNTPRRPLSPLIPDDLAPPEIPAPPREKALDFFAARAAHPGFYPMALLLGLSIHLPVEAIFRAIERRWPGPSNDLARSFLEAGTPKKIIIGAILVGLGPLVEEIFFRGALYRPLQKTSSPIATIAVTSVMFAISHFAAQTYLPIAIVGLTLGLARHASGSLIPPFLLHAAFNGLSLLAMASAPPGDPADQAAPPLWMTIAGTAVTVGLCAGLWALGARGRRREADR